MTNSEPVASPRQTVLCIAGQWFSGTSILNLLLNAQPGVRGIGEASHVYGNQSGYCSCGHSLSSCLFYADAPRDADFYRWCFERYRCEMLVDASKSWEMMRTANRDKFPMKVIVLSRHPHAWAYSYRAHHPEDLTPVSKLLDNWLFFYRQLLENLASDGMSPVFLAHEDMVRDPLVHIRRVCDGVGVSFDPLSLDSWWKTDTHIIGGNASAYRQLRSREEFEREHPAYVGEYHRLFLDERWKIDAIFRRECIDAYQHRSQKFEHIFGVLGQTPLQQQLAELHESTLELSYLIQKVFK